MKPIIGLQIFADHPSVTVIDSRCLSLSILLVPYYIAKVNETNVIAHATLML